MIVDETCPPRFALAAGLPSLVAAEPRPRRGSRAAGSSAFPPVGPTSAPASKRREPRPAGLSPLICPSPNSPFPERSAHPISVLGGSIHHRHALDHTQHPVHGPDRIRRSRPRADRSHRPCRPHDRIRSPDPGPGRVPSHGDPSSPGPDPDRVPSHGGPSSPGPDGGSGPGLARSRHLPLVPADASPSRASVPAPRRGPPDRSRGCPRRYPPRRVQPSALPGRRRAARRESRPHRPLWPELPRGTLLPEPQALAWWSSSSPLPPSVICVTWLHFHRRSIPPGVHFRDQFLALYSRSAPCLRGADHVLVGLAQGERTPHRTAFGGVLPPGRQPVPSPGRSVA